MKENGNFPGPGNARPIDNDAQIIKVPQDNTDWGGSKRSQPKDIRNKMTISHVGGNMKSGKK